MVFRFFSMRKALDQIKKINPNVIGFHLNFILLFD